MAPSALSRPTALVAGGSGAVGAVVCRLLVQDGWRVVATTRSPDRAAALAAAGVEPVILDVFDRDRLLAAASAVEPSVVIHQLTDLPKQFSPEKLEAARPGNARVRGEGTANLVAAARAAGARRLVAQSIAFAYAPGPRPHDERAPLDAAAFPSIVSLEQQVLDSGLDACILRYGRFYGPNTWSDVPTGEAPVHVEAAAHAARCAVHAEEPGIYNIAEDDGVVTSARARRILGWTPDFRMRRS
ncbi:MAG: NAD-dependent epimerase/dehydratase family protein [Vicinamibacterales bacterium]